MRGAVIDAESADLPYAFRCREWVDSYQLGTSRNWGAPAPFNHAVHHRWFCPKQHIAV
jgi:hypothetical protein